MSTAMMTRPASSGQASEEDAWIELDPWIEAEDILTAESLACVAPAPASRTEFIELDPGILSFASEDEMRFGDRTYTPEQAHVIELAVRRRRPLPAPSIPIDD